MADEQVITIDGKRYRLADLTKEAQTQLVNVRGVDQEITDLQRKAAIAQTARGAYLRALSDALKSVQPIGEEQASDGNAG
ncbi:MAG: hypothetical protein KDJ19_09410 [Hyphomicrobiaceae bacterium]|nr:hypothetical protein [Hyphomicrobiaceae bacterium]